MACGCWRGSQEGEVGDVDQICMWVICKSMIFLEQFFRALSSQNVCRAHCSQSASMFDDLLWIITTVGASIGQETKLDLLTFVGVQDVE